MFANLKKKLEEGGSVSPVGVDRKASSGGVIANSASRTQTMNYFHGEDTAAQSVPQMKRSPMSNRVSAVSEQPATAAASQIENHVDEVDSTCTKQELMELLLKRSHQIKALESKYSDLSSLLKEKSQMIEKLEVALEKQQDVHCQRLSELNERYNSCRAKNAECVAAAVKRKEDEMKEQLKELEAVKMELEVKVSELERLRDQRHDATEEIEAFSTQELSNVKQLLLKTQEELEILKAEKVTSSGVSDDTLHELQQQNSAVISQVSQLESQNAELTERLMLLQGHNDSLTTHLNDVRAELAQVAGSQDEWLEKQIESEKCISALEQQIRQLKAEISQRDADRTSMTQLVDSKTAEIASLQLSIQSKTHEVESLRSDLEQKAAVIAAVEERCQQSTDECQRVQHELSDMCTQLAECRGHLSSCRSEFTDKQKHYDDVISARDETVNYLHNDCRLLQQRVEELEQQREQLAASIETSVAERFQQDIRILEDQLQDKSRVIKKQDQRLSEVKKLMQRELKMAPPLLNDDDSTTALSALVQTATSGRSLSHVRNCSSVSVDSLTATGMLTSAIPAETLPSSPSQSATTARNGNSVSVDLASAAGIHKSATFPAANPSSPATLSVSDQLTVNGQCTPPNCTTTRSVGGQRLAAAGQRSQAGVVMSPADNEYDFLRELNFKYLRHVVLKFMLSREAEAMQLIKAVSMLLHFTVEEQQLIHDTLEWKMSWFGSRPPLSEHGQTAKIIPPSY